MEKEQVRRSEIHGATEETIFILFCRPPPLPPLDTKKASSLLFNLCLWCFGLMFPPSLQFLSSFTFFFYPPFFFVHSLYKHVTLVDIFPRVAAPRHVVHPIPLLPPPHPFEAGRKTRTHCARFHDFKIYFHVLCFVHTNVLINLMYYFGKKTNKRGL